MCFTDTFLAYLWTMFQCRLENALQVSVTLNRLPQKGITVTKVTKHMAKNEFPPVHKVTSAS